MSCHNTHYTNLHGNVNANLYLTSMYADSHTGRMDCIDWINAKLESKDVTQEQLRQAVIDAGLGKTTQPTISRILTRKTPNPGYKTVNALIRACGGDPDAFMKKEAVQATSIETALQSASLSDLSEELARRLAEPGKKLAKGW